MKSEYSGYAERSLQPTHKPIDHIYLDRLRHFTDGGGQYGSLNLPKLYDLDRVDTNTEYINIKSWKVPDGPNGETKRPLFKDIDWKKIEWEDANKGYLFGPSWKTFWFKVDMEIPPKWLKDSPEKIIFEWEADNEGLLYDENGSPIQAFSSSGQRSVCYLPKKWWKLGVQRFYLEMACNGMFGLGDQGKPDPNRYFRLNTCDLILPNVEARKLYWDFWILSDAARELPGLWQKYQAALVCNQIMNAFDVNDPKTVGTGRKLAKTLLGKDIDSDDVFHQDGGDGRIDVFAVGNCHIDTAWLWPFAETRRKIVRSWTSQLKIADQYPEYVFVASQMQQFKWLKQDHPDVYAKVKEKFTTNQFLPVGGSWVENDTNIPNGESLMRQFLLGQRFEMNEFGVHATTFWLPDTFGYSSQIPQLCRLAGMDRFLTQKLSWNNINQFPLTTFNWVSLDGSQVLVHMPPANTYTAGAHFGDVVRSQHQHQNLRDVPTGLLLYGHGDGGGGPTEEMIEKLRRCRGFANSTAAIPTVHVGLTIDDFYNDVLAKSNNGANLPTWRGEMYLEFHRGTYTTQAKIKKFMRLGEVKLHDLEYLATLLSLTDKDYKYPKKELQALWEDICLCQFHDVLPGSCIGMVYYEEVYPMFEKFFAKINKLIKEALGQFKGKPTFVNTLPWARTEVVRVPKDDFVFETMSSSKDCVVSDGKAIASVTSSNGKFTVNKVKYPAQVKKVDDFYELSNDLLLAKISDDGIITSLYDNVNDREIIDSLVTKETPGGGNQFILVQDEPLTYPAWDTELYSLEKMKFLSGGKVSILENNEVRSSLVVKHEISKDSSIETVISLDGATDKSTNFLKFKCHVKWHETYKFLKVQFPTTIYTATDANYETQFGVTKRPTHYNTTWDVARFEVCHHKFMDLSEHNYGVSVVNNSKYGGLIHGNLMRLSLLRSAKAPDDEADMGDHDFEYAIFPHEGTLGASTVRLGWEFNYPLLSSKGEVPNAISLEGDSSLVLSHLKRSEDDKEISTHENIPSKDQKSFIVRVYESLGGSSKGKLVVDPEVLKISKVYRTCGLENEIEELKLNEDQKVDIKLRGFEVASFKFVLK